MRAAFVACSGPSHRMWSEGINDETKPKPRRCDVGGIFAKPPPLMLSLFLIIATRGLHVALGLGRLRITCHTLHGPPNETSPWSKVLNSRKERSPRAEVVGPQHIPLQRKRGSQRSWVTSDDCVFGKMRLVKRTIRISDSPLRGRSLPCTLPSFRTRVPSQMLGVIGVGLLALMPVPNAPRLRPSAGRRSATSSVRLYLEMQKTEAVKACAISTLAGGLASIPLSPLALSLTDQVEYISSEYVGFEVGLLLAQLGLFGAVYRCTVRSDDNSMLRQGAVGAFALCRAIASLPPSDYWDSSLTKQLAVYFGEGWLVFGFAAVALEYAFSRGDVLPVPGIGLPQDGDGYDGPIRGFVGGFSDFFGLRGRGYRMPLDMPPYESQGYGGNPYYGPNLPPDYNGMVRPTRRDPRMLRSYRRSRDGYDLF